MINAGRPLEKNPFARHIRPTARLEDVSRGLYRSAIHDQAQSDPAEREMNRCPAARSFAACGDPNVEGGRDRGNAMPRRTVLSPADNGPAVVLPDCTETGLARIRRCERLWRQFQGLTDPPTCR